MPTLENDDVRVSIDSRTGAMAGFADGEWEIQARPELGLSFRLLLPLSERRNNSVIGLDQEPPQIETSDSSITLRWPRVRSEYGGDHEIGVTQSVRLTERRIVFGLTIDNRSEFTVENAWYPCLGDVRPPVAGESLRTFTGFYGTALQTSVLPTFDNNAGYWGVDVPSQIGGQEIGRAGIVPVSPFMLLLANGRGVYVGVAEQRWDVVAWWLELRPGYGDSLHRRAADDAAVQLAAAHAPFVAPGEKCELTPIAVEPFIGDWHDGADLYRRASGGWPEPIEHPAWVDEPHSWLQCQINFAKRTTRTPASWISRIPSRNSSSLPSFGSGRCKGFPRSWPPTFQPTS